MELRLRTFILAVLLGASSLSVDARAQDPCAVERSLGALLESPLEKKLGSITTIASTTDLIRRLEELAEIASHDQTRKTHDAIRKALNELDPSWLHKRPATAEEVIQARKWARRIDTGSRYIPEQERIEAIVEVLDWSRAPKRLYELVRDPAHRAPSIFSTQETLLGKVQARYIAGLSSETKRELRAINVSAWRTRLRKQALLNSGVKRLSDQRGSPAFIQTWKKAERNSETIRNHSYFQSLLAGEEKKILSDKLAKFGSTEVVARSMDEYFAAIGLDELYPNHHSFRTALSSAETVRKNFSWALRSEDDFIDLYGSIANGKGGPRSDLDLNLGQNAFGQYRRAINQRSGALRQAQIDGATDLRKLPLDGAPGNSAASLPSEEREVWSGVLKAERSLQKRVRGENRLEEPVVSIGAYDDRTLDDFLLRNPVRVRIRSNRLEIWLTDQEGSRLLKTLPVSK